jgi:hypothetical protein
MNNACPQSGCDAIYNLTAQHVGKQFACRKCGTLLFVETEGLRAVDPHAPHLPEASPPAAGRPAAPPGSPVGANDIPLVPRRPAQPSAFGLALRSFGRRLTDDLSSWLFGAGAFLVVVFLFFPLIDVAKTKRMDATIKQGADQETRAAEEFRKKTNPTADEKKARQAVADAWDKMRREMEADLQDQTFSTDRSRYWYAWGMMLGFLCLSAAAIGYLRPQQTLVRRIVGAVVLCGQLLLIFLAYANGSVSLLTGK